MEKKRTLSRRGFLKRAAKVAGAAAAIPAIVPSSVFGVDAPSNKILMGAIGIGGMGRGTLAASSATSASGS